MFISILRKILATVLAFVGIWLSIVFGSLYSMITDNTLIGILLVLSGIYLSYILAFFLYGFGYISKKGDKIPK